MSSVFEIVIYIGAAILIPFLFSLIKFYFYRKRQIHKIKIVEFIVNPEKTASTYNIHRSIFKNKSITYVTDLLHELELQKIIKKVDLGHTNNNNGLWEYIHE